MNPLFKAVAEQRVKQTKKIGKHKIKEIEQEEQLKLVKSAINNLERKLGELENSHKLVKQKLSLLKSKKGEFIDDSNTQTNQLKEQIPFSGEIDSNSRAEYSIGRRPTQYETPSFKEQIKSLEIDNLMVKNRLQNLETNRQQQQQPPTHLCQHLAHHYPCQNPYGGPFGGLPFINPYFGGAMQQNPYMYYAGNPFFIGTPTVQNPYLQQFAGIPHGMYTLPPNLVTGAAPPPPYSRARHPLYLKAILYMECIDNPNRYIEDPIKEILPMFVDNPRIRLIREPVNQLNHLEKPT